MTSEIRRQHHDGYVFQRRIRSDPLGDLESVQIGHAGVEQDEFVWFAVIPRSFQLGQRGQTVPVLPSPAWPRR